MKVRLLLFAVLRDLVGESEMTLELEPGARAVDVWASLREKHAGLASHEKPPMTAINETYVQPDAELHDGDELVFIPPVAGG